MKKIFLLDVFEIIFYVPRENFKDCFMYPDIIFDIFESELRFVKLI